MTTPTYTSLLQTLYAATLDPQQWPLFLQDLCASTGSVVGFLVRNDSTRGRQFLACGGSAAPVGEEGYVTADPVREAFMRAPRTGVIEVEDFLPNVDLLRSDYYPVMAAAGVRYGTVIVPQLSLRRYELITLWRGERPRLEPDLAGLLRDLFPHIRTALAIHTALGVERERAQTAEAMLDASPTASFLLAASGRLLCTNTSAEKLLQAADALCLHNGRVLPTQPDRRADFSERLAAAAHLPHDSGHALVVPRARGGPPLHLLLSRFRCPGSPQHNAVLVLATDPGRSPQFPDTVLHQLYGLTPAETEIANGMLTGFSLEEIAAVRGVSIGTVRGQVKSLLSKTGQRRQVDLVRLLCTLPNRPVA